MLDRLQNLRQRNSEVCSLSHLASQNSIEKTERNQQQICNEGISKQFFQNIETARVYSNQIQNNIEKGLRIQQKYHKAVRYSQQRSAMKEIQVLYNQNLRIYKRIKVILQLIKHQVKKQQQDNGLTYEPQTQMKQNIYNAAIFQLIQIIKQERLVNQNSLNYIKWKLEKQVKWIDQKFCDQNVCYFVDNPEKIQSLMHQEYYKACKSKRQLMEDIDDKFRQIEQLQKAVSDSFQFFQQLLKMTLPSEVLVNDIQIYCANSKNYIQKATLTIYSPRKTHLSRKCLCILNCIGFTLIISILISIVVVFAKK